MTRLPRVLAFDYFRQTYIAPLRVLIELAAGVASFALIGAIVIGVI